MGCLRSVVLVHRARAATRKAARERRRRLVREMAVFTSESDLNDLGAILDRYPDGVTYEIRDIVARQRTRSAWPGWPQRLPRNRLPRNPMPRTGPGHG